MCSFFSIVSQCRSPSQLSTSSWLHLARDTHSHRQSWSSPTQSLVEANMSWIQNLERREWVTFLPYFRLPSTKVAVWVLFEPNSFAWAPVRYRWILSVCVNCSWRSWLAWGVYKLSFRQRMPMIYYPDQNWSPLPCVWTIFLLLLCYSFVEGHVLTPGS